MYTVVVLDLRTPVLTVVIALLRAGGASVSFAPSQALARTAVTVARASPAKELALTYGQ